MWRGRGFFGSSIEIQIVEYEIEELAVWTTVQQVTSTWRIAKAAILSKDLLHTLQIKKFLLRSCILIIKRKFTQVFRPLIFQCIVRAIRRVATIWCRLYIVEYLYYILHALCLCQEVRARRVSVSASECACLHIVSCSWKLCNSIIHLTDSINKLRSLWEKHCWNKIY